MSRSHPQHRRTVRTLGAAALLLGLTVPAPAAALPADSLARLAGTYAGGGPRGYPVRVEAGSPTSEVRTETRASGWSRVTWKDC